MATFHMPSNSRADDEADGSQRAATDSLGLPPRTPQRTAGAGAAVGDGGYGWPSVSAWTRGRAIQVYPDRLGWTSCFLQRLPSQAGLAPAALWPPRTGLRGRRSFDVAPALAGQSARCYEALGSEGRARRSTRCVSTTARSRHRRDVPSTMRSSPGDASRP